MVRREIVMFFNRSCIEAPVMLKVGVFDGPVYRSVREMIVLADGWPWMTTFGEPLLMLIYYLHEGVLTEHVNVS